MKIAYIVGSPKKKNSTSEKFLIALSEKMPENNDCWVFTDSLIADSSGEKMSELVEKVVSNDVLVFSFPLYIDSIPSHLINFLEALEGKYKESNKDARIYSIINCGFFEPENTDIAVEMIKLWTAHCGLTFGQAVVAGGGGMVPTSKIGEGPLISYGLALDELVKNITDGVGGSTVKVKPKIPRFVYIFGGNSGWKRSAKKRGVSMKSLKGKDVPK